MSDSTPIALLQAVIASGQRQVEGFTWLGRIYETQNRTDEAIAFYEKAVQLQPGFENVSLESPSGRTLLS